MSNIATVGIVIAAGVACVIFLSGGGLERNLRACLEDHSLRISSQDHVYMTEALDEEIWRSYPDGTATRFVKYRVQGSSDVKTATCRW